METTKYNSLGLNIFKYNQAGLFIFSLLILGVNYLLSSSVSFWLFLFGILIMINLIWYRFSDIKWNQKSFVIEKFLNKRTIASDKFIKVDRLFFNVFIIKFVENKFYYSGDFKSLSESPIEITKKIKETLNQSSNH